MLARAQFLLAKPSREIVYQPKKGNTLRYAAFVSLPAIFLIFFVSLAALLSLIIDQRYAHAAVADTASLTYKNDNAHTGQYPNETKLNTSNVNSSQFGKRITYPVDGQIYAQPLYMPQLSVNGAIHNVVFVATEHDSVYAFDADQTAVQPPLWHRSFLTRGVTSVPSKAVSCNDMQPEIGITSTPVIDSATHTMYVVSYTFEYGKEVYRLHALNVTTGRERSGSPIVIRASVPGHGRGSVKGWMRLNAQKERQRAALLQANGQMYIAFGSFCDNSPYEGWILGYTYNGSTFRQAEAYTDAANGSGGGIWGSGGGISADDDGYIYATTGNGDFNLNMGGTDAGDSVIKLNAHLKLQDYMTPFNQSCLDKRDADLGSGGPLMLTSLHEMILGGKEGRIYVLNTNDLGKFTKDSTLDCSTSEQLRTDIDRVLQEFAPTKEKGIYCSPALWRDANGQLFIYLTDSGGYAKAYQLTNGRISKKPVSQTPERFGFTGGNAIVSSNGAARDTGVLWLIDPQAVLHAYDAANLATELYSSTQNSHRDGLDSYVKFSSPMVANGEVFVPTTHALTIFGQLSS